MASALKKELKMRKLRPEEVGSSRLTMMATLARSPDPFGAARYELNAEPCLELAQKLSSQWGTKITSAHVINKLLACAIAENPVFNQIVLGSSVYQTEEVHIANAALLPGREQALTYIVLENPHRKSLRDIQQESIARMVQAAKDYAASKGGTAERLMRLYFRAGLYRLVSEKISFAAAFRKGLLSNIILSNHEYGGPACFNILKPVSTLMKVPLRIHSHGAPLRPHVDNGALTVKRVFPLTVIVDHRIIHGVHGQQLGRSLERMAADPEKYLA